MSAGRATSRINAAAWLAWFTGAAAIPLVSRNPLYLGLIFLVVIVVHLTVTAGSEGDNTWRLFAYVGSMVASLSIAFNVLTVHAGNRVFGHIPEWVPIAGGDLTWNALVYGVASALAISSLLFAAATFNTAVRHGELIRLMPASLSRLGIAGTIAISFVPQTISAGRDIYDAQRSRGHQFRGLRDARSLVVPLLATGIERAVVLSEALETRGFGAPAMRQQTHRRSPAFMLAFLALLAALAALATGRLLIAGIALVIVLLLLAVATKQPAQRTRYRPLHWNTASIIVVLASLAPVLTLVAHFATGLSLSYEPFPRLPMPDFAPAAGASILMLLTPALVDFR